MEGKFQTDRSIFEHGIWNNVTEFRLFFFIYGNAVWSEEGVNKGDVHIKRGEFLRSYRKLRDDLMYIENKTEKHYSLSNIKRIIQKLEKDGRIMVKKTELGTLFQVVNYEQYQGFAGQKKENREQSENSERTVREHSENNNKKEKKEKKDKKEIYGDSVRLTKKQHDKLVEKFGKEETADRIERLDLYINSKGKKYPSHYHTILAWARKDEKENSQGYSPGSERAPLIE